MKTTYSFIQTQLTAMVRDKYLKTKANLGFFLVGQLKLPLFVFFFNFFKREKHGTLFMGMNPSTTHLGKFKEKHQDETKNTIRSLNPLL